ncbi:MAG: cobyrinate a,c-diamide synthase, partial [Anaerolineae bacterium]|nr:cobyrinate a,c-diamide synthase [Anaerolineae bacterium]
CGGFMYLTEAIIDLDGRLHPMVGLVPGISRMQPRLKSLGYRIAQTESGNFLLPKGMTARGHEFHWSSWEQPSQAPDGENGHPAFSPQPAWYVQPRQANGGHQPNGFADGNLLGSYIHLHFAHDLQLAPNFVQACRDWRNVHGC